MCGFRWHVLLFPLLLLPGVSHSQSCTPLTLQASSVPQTVGVGSEYVVSCDYGRTVDAIAVLNPAGQCGFGGFHGTAAEFRCLAPSNTGTFSHQCVLTSGTKDNICPSTTQAGSSDARVPVLPPPLAADPPGSCWGGNCLSYGFISYFGGGTAAGGYRNLNEIISTWPQHRNDVYTHFVDIRNTLHAKAVRINLFPTDPYNNDGGVIQFPQPSQANLDAINGLIDTAAQAGLEVFLVMAIPDGYLQRDPAAKRTGQSTDHATDLFNYWDSVFASIGANRFAHIRYVDVFGDFYPGDTTRRREDWWRRIWYGFSNWYEDLIPFEKKIFEVTAGRTDPVNGLVNNLRWVQNEIRSNGWKEPVRYSVSAYADASWANSYPDWWKAYTDLFTKLAQQTGGYDRLLIEEIGVSKMVGTAPLSGFDTSGTNDHLEGEQTFSYAFGVLQNLNPNVPVGVWLYWDAPRDWDGLYGVYKNDGSRAHGWWLLPHSFAR